MQHRAHLALVLSQLHACKQRTVHSSIKNQLHHMSYAATSLWQNLQPKCLSLLESQHVFAFLCTGSGLQHNTAEKLQFGAWGDLLRSLAECIPATSSSGFLCCLH